MVCKEQLCDWFRSLSPYKRIDYMCALMQLLVPLELRFLGSVLEDLCKKDFLFLRDAETKANNNSHLTHITNLSEILISLSLLHSTRSRCSNALFNVIHAYLQRCFNKILATEPDKFPDLMTMLTLTVNHPAFSYEQKQSIYEFYSRACDYSRDKKIDKEDVTLHLPDGYEFRLDSNTISTHTQLHMTQKATISGLEVKENSKRHHDNRFEIKVMWSDDRVEYVYKTTKELLEFQNKLCKLFPSTGEDNTKIPVLKTRDEKHAIPMYIRKLGKLPKHILSSVHVVEFFKGDNSPKSSCCASSSPSNFSVEDEEITDPHFPMKTLTYVNSQNIGQEFNRLQDVTIPHRQLTGQTLLTRLIDSPSQSPHSSSTESPQNSPVASPSSQQSELTSELPDFLHKYSFDQILLMKDDDLVKAGLSKEALKKLRVKINEHFTCEKTNGMIETGIPIQNIPTMYPRFPPPQFTHPPPAFCHFNPPIRLPTRDSSPCNSEPSSPPASPHLQQHSNLVKPPGSQGSEDKATREEKDCVQAASIPRTGGGKVSQGSVKYPPHTNKPPEGLLPQPPLQPNIMDLTHDLQGLSNQNGFQSDNPQGMVPPVRPDIMNFRQFTGKHANVMYPQKLLMMQTDKAPPYAYAPIQTTGFSNMMDNQTRPYMNQPGILGQPPNVVSSRPGFTSVANSTTITCPRTSLTPTPPMPGNPGTKSPNTVSSIVNSSSDPSLQSNEPSNSPSPLQMNAPPPANTSVPCSVGPVAHNNQPCSACGSRPHTGWSIQGLNGFIPPIPSMHPYHPQIHQQTFANGTHSELIFSQVPPMFYNATPFINMTYGNNMYQNVPGNGAPKKMYCCNCGDSSHKAPDCKESTMENTAGHFKLNFKTKSDSD